MRLFSLPKSVYFFWLISYLSGFLFFTVLVVAFFKEWAGISQFQIQLLGAIYGLASMLFEIPTGAIADKKGKKISILIGYILLTISPLIYSIFPLFWLFVIAEIIMALGYTFISGAQEALLYDYLHKESRTHDYPTAQIGVANSSLLGLISASLISPLLLQFMGPNHVVQFSSIFFALAAFIIYKYIPDVELPHEPSQKPNYKKIITRSVTVLRENKTCQRIIWFYLSAYSLGYFIKWFYQTQLQHMQVESIYYGYFHAFLLLSSLGITFILVYLTSRFGRQRFFLGFSVLATTVSCFLIPFSSSTTSILLLLFTGGWYYYGLWDILSPYFNKHIESGNRATVLSFVSLIESLFVRVLVGPLLGFLVDVDIKLVFFILSVIGIATLAFLLPRHKDLSL